MGLRCSDLLQSHLTQPLFFHQHPANLSLWAGAELQFIETDAVRDVRLNRRKRRPPIRPSRLSAGHPICGCGWSWTAGHRLQCFPLL